MSPENRKRITEAVGKAGDELKGKLPELATHPDGRNSYAHIWHAIKEKYGHSYKECTDEQVDEILSLVEQVRNS